MTDKAKITDKIRKLLALATSPNDAEARAALLKARSLMAEYKLQTADIGDAQQSNENVVNVTMWDYDYSMRRDTWILHIGMTIAENMCCKFAYCAIAARTYVPSIYGLESDVQATISAIEYAVKYVKYKIQQMKREMKSYGESGRAIANAAYSYGVGFAAGLRDAYDAAKEISQETALVMVVPQEVEEAYMQETTAKAIQSRRPVYDSSYNDGYADGRSYQTPKAQLA